MKRTFRFGVKATLHFMRVMCFKFHYTELMRTLVIKKALYEIEN